MMFMPLLQLHLHARILEIGLNGGTDLHGEPILGRWISDFFHPLPSKTQGLFDLRARYHGQSGNSDHERQPLIQHLARAHVIEGDVNRSECENPRDKIYGLLGFAADIKELRDVGLRVDYKKLPSLVFTEAAGAMISCGHPDILSYCQFPKSDPEMPSWVPDWRMPIRRPCGGHAWDTAFKASRGKRFEAVMENQGIFDLKLLVSEWTISILFEVSGSLV